MDVHHLKLLIGPSNSVIYLTSGPVDIELSQGRNFWECTSLSHINSGIEIVSGDYNLMDCHSLQNINIEHTWGSTREGLLSQCYALSYIIFDNNTNLQTISSYSFEDCASIMFFKFEAKYPPVLEDYNAFNNTNNAPIFVPAESVDRYKSAENWSNLSSRIFAIPDWLENV